jgi:hypothetical protein
MDAFAWDAWGTRGGGERGFIGKAKNNSSEDWGHLVCQVEGHTIHGIGLGGWTYGCRDPEVTPSK